MKYIAIMLLLGVLGCKVLPAQKKGTPASIGKVSAFYEQHFMGNLPVDENGNPLRSAAFVVYTFYIETLGADAPTWQILSSGKDTLSISATEEVPGENVTIGKQKGMAEAFVLQKTKGTRLWKIESGPVDGTAENDKHKSFMLTGTYGGKKFSCPVSEAIGLETIPNP